MFIANGVRKIRVTGGEPLVRKGYHEPVPHAWRASAGWYAGRTDATTNGTLLARHAEELARAGVRRVNVSLDTLDAERYAQITRWGWIERVLEGIEAAQDVGLRVKINAVALRGAFEHEVDDLIRFAHGRGMDLTVIEEMPFGQAGRDRRETHLPLPELRWALSARWTLSPLADSTGGPARYLRVAETGGRLGFIAPMSCNFCASCNRVRVSCSGRLYTCMGDEGAVGLLGALRGSEGNAAVEALIRQAVYGKPAGHDFCIGTDAVTGIDRHMSALGG